jgi:hypothetical protein
MADEISSDGTIRSKFPNWALTGIAKLIMPIDPAGRGLPKEPPEKRSAESWK